LIFFLTIGNLAFHSVTSFMGVVHPSCPYITWWSQNVKKPLDDLRFERPVTDYHPEILLWLAKNTRKPDVADSSYQALAGLRLSADPLQYYDTIDVSDVDSYPPSNQYRRDMPNRVITCGDARWLLSGTIDRFWKFSANACAISTDAGSCAAQYATAMLKMATYVHESTAKVGWELQSSGAYYVRVEQNVSYFRSL
jgi:hypothetical protein